MMKLNDEKIKTKYDLYDTVAFVITAPTYEENVYQTPFGHPYDLYTSTTKSEIKVRKSLEGKYGKYKDLEIPYTKVAEMLLEKYNDEKQGLKYNYIFQCPVVTENKIYTVDLDTVLSTTYKTMQRPVNTVDEPDNFINRIEYKIPFDKWTVIECDCSKYDYYIEKGTEKYLTKEEEAKN